ncbi:MAG: glycoside hydrolase family 15 protein [Taibaiella sp.]|nr:glycoside hydrolase family 15 protein [Taibaiella sp.]
MQQQLRDYALIGNSRAAALIGKDGSIDWCCLPEFHSPSIFAAVLDTEKGGSFALSPTGRYKSTQHYIDDTNVVCTLFTTAEGIARITDCFVAMEEDKKKKELFPDHEILRIVEGISGKVEFKFEFRPRVYYGRTAPKLVDRGKLGIHFFWQEGTYIVNSTLGTGVAAISVKDSGAIAGFSVTGGERVIFSLSYTNQAPAIIPELERTGYERMQGTVDYWQNWMGRCAYSGPYEAHVRRSALVLKLLTHAPSGAIVAAPTTSLPEEIGGERNWDYRYCWLRDASITVRALRKLGFDKEMEAYMSWILHATRLTAPELQVLYSVYGDATLREENLSWLSGYKNSAPVRIGNKAYGQFQLDVYGEVLDAVYQYSEHAGKLDNGSQNFVSGLGKVICGQWTRPDNGIWEIRREGRHHTHSKAMAWVGLDRLVKLCRKYGWSKKLGKKFSDTARAISAEIESKGFNMATGTYTSEFGGDKLDASLLTLPLTGYCSVSSPRMRATMKEISNRLMENNLLYRYKSLPDGVSGRDTAFALCNFWLAENHAMLGDIDRAKELFEAVINKAGPTLLLSEEIDTDTGELLGNYPQGFSHIGLVNAAYAINKAINKGK